MANQRYQNNQRYQRYQRSQSSDRYQNYRGYHRRKGIAVVPILIVFAFLAVLVGGGFIVATQILPASSTTPEPTTDPNALSITDTFAARGPELTEALTPVPVVPPADYKEYTGVIEHIFFHPLVCYPELAFDGDSNAPGMDDYMTTTTEFLRTLEDLYKKDYILVNIEKCYGYMDKDGDGTKEYYGKLPLYLPPGKKPVIVSTDDMNYYKYMQENGCNYKMVLNDKGKIAMYSKDPSGKEVISQDTEVVTILDKFVAAHPDFSHEGAKGIVGVTGYDGILGYRTQSGSPNREAEIEAVKPIIAELKASGWTFASHSYGHPDMKVASFEKVKRDTDLFNEEVMPLIGKTEIFFFPHGAWPKHGTDSFEYLYNVGGFRHFSGVGVVSYEKNHDGRYVFDDRKNIDGITMRVNKHLITYMLDIDYIMDKEARGEVRGQGIGVKKKQ